MSLRERISLERLQMFRNGFAIGCLGLSVAGVIDLVQFPSQPLLQQHRQFFVGRVFRRRLDFVDRSRLEHDTVDRINSLAGRFARG